MSPALISNDGKRVTAFVRTTVSAAITCHITTSGGREDDRTIYLNVVER